MSSTNGHKANGVNGAKQGDKAGPNSPPTEYQFKPGQSGNPSGRRKGPQGKSIAKAIKGLVDEGLEGKDLAEALARVAVKRALSGDIRFYQMILERIDGKVADKVVQDGMMEILVKYEDDAIKR